LWARIVTPGVGRAGTVDRHPHQRRALRDDDLVEPEVRADGDQVDEVDERRVEREGGHAVPAHPVGADHVVRPGLSSAWSDWRREALATIVSRGFSARAVSVT